MEKIKNWLNHPIYTMNFWAYIIFLIGGLLVGMMGMFIIMTYSIIDWGLAQQKSWVAICMLAVGSVLVIASYFGTKRTK